MLSEISFVITKSFLLLEIKGESINNCYRYGKYLLTSQIPANGRCTVPEKLIETL
jgi:hypothetical protein